MKRISRLTLLGFALIALLACDEKGQVAVEEDEIDPNLPPARVDLPTPPPASGFEVAEKNADGSLRVEGLIHHQEKHLDEKVSVKGVIVRISPPCDPKKAQKQGEKCPEPSMFIKDTQDSQAVLRLVGFDDEFIKKKKVEVGQEHTFRGSYQKVAYGFVATEDGLILLDYVGEHPVVEPSKK